MLYMIIITTYKLILQAGMQAIHLAATKDIVDILIDGYGVDPHAKVCRCVNVLNKRTVIL